MTASNHDPERRRLLRYVAFGAAALPLATLAPLSRPARADLPRVDESSDQAQQLNYVHDADADAAANRGDGEYCRNCRHFSNEQDGWGECPFFRGNRVASTGWCAVWGPA